MLAYFLKGLIILTCLILLLTQVRKCLTKYLEYNTSATHTVRLTSQAAAMPSFTICPQYDVAFKQNYLQRFGMSREVYRTGNYLPADIPLHGHEHRSVFENASHSLGEMLSSMKLNTWSLDNKTIFIPVVHGGGGDSSNNKVDPELAKWTKLYHKLYGHCYNLEIFAKASELGVSEVIFQGRMDLYIFYHYPGQFLDYNTGAKVKYRSRII